MQFRLFDVNNNQTIQDVTYIITVTRGTASSAREPLLLVFFHTKNGLLTIHAEPTPGPLTVYGDQDPFLNAWMADPGGNILIRGPILLQAYIIFMLWLSIEWVILSGGFRLIISGLL